MSSVIDEPPPLDWRLALLAMCAAHGAATVLLRVVSVLGPELVVHHGWTPELVGAVATAANIGSVGFVLVGSGVLRALGSTRAIGAGLICGIGGLLLLSLPVSLAVLLAGLMLGLAHAPAHPAGNDLLDRYAPVSRRSLVFSIKQSAPPLGGMLAGLVLPSVAIAFGLWAALAVAGAVVVLAVIALLPLHRRHGTRLVAASWKGAFALRSLAGPLRVVLGDPQLRRIALVGLVLSLVHSVWLVYLPIYLSLEIGLPVTIAGILFAVLQAGAFAGRILLGWSADRLVAPRVILMAALGGTALTTTLLPIVAGTAATLPLALLVGITGIVAAGWNGVQVAEVVRLAGRERLLDAVSGLMVVTGTGVVIGPMLFPPLLAIAGNWGLAFHLLAGFPVVALLVIAIARLRS
jgi:MFS family permease